MHLPSKRLSDSAQLYISHGYVFKVWFNRHGKKHRLGTFRKETDAVKFMAAVKIGYDLPRGQFEYSLQQWAKGFIKGY